METVRSRLNLGRSAAFSSGAQEETPMALSVLKQTAVFAGAALAGTAAVLIWPHDQLSRCPLPSPASVERLFAPCQAAAHYGTAPDRSQVPQSPEIAPSPSPSVTPPAQEPAVARRGREGTDVDVTGAVRSK